MAKTGDSLYGHYRQSYVLGKELGSGGEGTVYRTNDENLVAKIYKNPSAETERKILSMLKLNIEMKSPGGIPLITWPKDILYQGGSFAGYVMPFAEGGEPIWNMGRPEGRNKVFHGKYDWSKALAVATNIASLVSYLHSMGIVIGDMNSNNIFVHSNGYVTIMDVDSFDIQDKDTKEHFKCKVGRPEFLAPELQARRLSEESAVFTQQTDNFALAVHIFQLLFYAHPFNMKMIDRKEGSRGENQQADAIVEGDCPFVKPGYEHMIQAGVPYMSMLPDYLQEDFRETFSYNALNSVQRREMRTRAVKWFQDLGRLYQEKDRELIQCSVNPEHYYLRSRGCELCRAKKRLDDQNKRIAQWDVQSVCVNRQQTDVITNLSSVSSKEQWYSHYKVNNSPLSMSIPLYVRRIYPNGDSTEIQRLPQTYKTGDWISIEGSTQKEEQKQAGLYTIELFDEKQQLLMRNSIHITEPAAPPAGGGTIPGGNQGQQPSAPKTVPFYKKRGPMIAVIAAVLIAAVCMFDNDDTDSAGSPSSPEHTPTILTDTGTTQTWTTNRSTESATEPFEASREETQPGPEETMQAQEAGNDFMTGTVEAGMIHILNYTGRNVTRICISESLENLEGDNVLRSTLEFKYYVKVKVENSHQSSWNMLVVTEDGSGWHFLGLDPDLIAYGSELQVIYQDHSVFAEIASNSSKLNGQVIGAEYKNMNPPATQASTEVRSEYILPDSDRRYYTKSELSGLTLDELRIARNELYARHGRIFKNEELQAYFEGCSWYHGTILSDDFKDDLFFNDYEKKNRDLIIAVENEKKS